jgi:sodium pump decarboxylase gamma subunit
MILEGIKIMIIGMGTVFVMLATLIVATVIASRIIAAFPGDHPEAHPSGGEKGKPLAAIITAAVALFRKQRNN